MKCRLCLEDKILIKAHIFPDFMYKSIYDAGHKLIKLSLSNDYSKIISTGEYDPNILCADCDNRIGVYETYASNIFHNVNAQKYDKPIFNKVKNLHGIEIIEMTNIKYKLFKLFLLSILWRCSITDRPNFSDVKLSIQAEGILRDMIFNEDPGEIYDFPCVIMSFLNTNIEKGFVGSPRRFISNTRVVFVIAGFMYTYYLSDSDKPVGELEVCINKYDKMAVVCIPESSVKKMLNSFFGREIF